MHIMAINKDYIELYWTLADKILAEGMGFEPTIRLLTVYPLSRRAPSTTRPPFRKLQIVSGRFCLVVEARGARITLTGTRPPFVIPKD